MEVSDRKNLVIGVTSSLIATALLALAGFATGRIWIIVTFFEKDALAAALWTLIALFVGTLVGATVRHRMAVNKLKAKDDIITDLKNDLEKRPTREQMDEALSEKDARISELESPPILTDEQALNLVRSLTDNQHAILREMYDHGGTLLVDPLDGDMQQLARYGMAERPSMFVPGMECKWTLPPSVNMIIREHPDVLESEAERRTREVKAQLDQFSAAQLDLMVRIADAESDDGFLAASYLSQDHKIASQLQELLVTTCDTEKDRCLWYLLPQWRKFVATGRAEIEEQIKPLKDRREKDAEERRREEEAFAQSREGLPSSAPVVRH